MKASSRSAAQLLKMIRKGFHVKLAANELAERIERGPVRSCVPHKKRKKEIGMILTGGGE